MKLATKLSLLLLLFLSFNLNADKIVLKGNPVILIPQSDFYIFPNAYTPATNYHFVDISGDPRICFLNLQPQLSSLDQLRINIVQNNKKHLWYCYRYDSRFFSHSY